uniref:Uncharacterized protein n=1 Tax=Nelumbo nucifera TaxID=4432 RepID=A0A822Y1H8_NELNU|nr:TPA_asm: hypothetical protein HUJ06_026389 [Nelumbo nucifera]
MSVLPVLDTLKWLTAPFVHQYQEKGAGYTASQRFQSIANQGLKPLCQMQEYVDAKISSIERKPHDSGCACRFYVICYRSQEPHTMLKMTLGEEIREVKLENIGILQKLQRKPSEDVYYRWSYSEDCSFTRRAILHCGQFSSDISWLLVASIWKGLGFDVKTVQNKMIYQLLDSDHDMCPPSYLNNVKTINFQIDNEVMEPSNMNFSPVVPVNTFVLNDPKDVDLVHDMKEDKHFLHICTR